MLPFVHAPCAAVLGRGRGRVGAPRKRPRARGARAREPARCVQFGGGARGAGAGAGGAVQDYADWSADFLGLCRAQLELLADCVAGVGQGAIFFRREHAATGALEFVPLVVLSHSGAAAAAARAPGRVWVSPGSAAGLSVGAPAGAAAAAAAAAALELPGGIPASRLLPDYPFVALGADGGIVMPDGGLCVPVEYNDGFAGSVVLWREPAAAPAPWRPEEVTRVRHVARSIALGAALEGKVASAREAEKNSRVVIESIRALLRSSMHQIRSPIAALVTFGHLLLRKLPPGDALRSLAKNVVVESLRLDDLLEPLDQAQKKLGVGAPSPVFSGKPASAPMLRTGVHVDGADKNADFTDGARVGEVGLPERETTASSEWGNQASPELVWVSDILEPIANSAAVLAKEKGLEFLCVIDDDTPPVFVVERDIREALYNLVENAVRYTPVGGYVGIQSCAVEDEDERTLVEVLIWDTGPGVTGQESQSIWENGYRGRAATASGVAGSGMGLSICREAVANVGGTIEVQSPLPDDLDTRDKPNPEQPGSVFRLLFPRASM